MDFIPIQEVANMVGLDLSTLVRRFNRPDDGQLKYFRILDRYDLSKIRQTLDRSVEWDASELQDELERILDPRYIVVPQQWAELIVGWSQEKKANVEHYPFHNGFRCNCGEPLQEGERSLLCPQGWEKCVFERARFEYESPAAYQRAMRDKQEYLWKKNWLAQQVNLGRDV